MTLYIFDKDNTLIGGLSNRPANTPDEQKPLPGVVEKLAQLREAGHTLTIASNQGGVSWGFISNEDANALLIDACKKCGIGLYDYLFCPYDPRGTMAEEYRNMAGWRKPLPGMLIELMRLKGFEAGDTIVVGDQESDRQSAEAAGVRFEWAKDFFEWRNE